MTQTSARTQPPLLARKRHGDDLMNADKTEMPTISAGPRGYTWVRVDSTPGPEVY
jgi:hypothetical protein